MPKFSCGHRADPALTRSEITYLKVCFNCTPERKKELADHKRESQERNIQTQREFDRIGRGDLGPLGTREP